MSQMLAPISLGTRDGKLQTPSLKIAEQLDHMDLSGVYRAFNLQSWEC